MTPPFSRTGESASLNLNRELGSESQPSEMDNLDYNPSMSYDWMSILDSLDSYNAHNHLPFDFDANNGHVAPGSPGKSGHGCNASSLELASTSTGENGHGVDSSSRGGLADEESGRQSEVQASVSSDRDGSATYDCKGDNDKAGASEESPPAGVKGHFKECIGSTKAPPSSSACSSSTSPSPGDRASPSTSETAPEKVGVRPAPTKEQEDDEEAAKKMFRVERKRSRERQRREDTNSQFAALVQILRDIESRDFVEEASHEWQAGSHPCLNNQNGYQRLPNGQVNPTAATDAGTPSVGVPTSAVGVSSNASTSSDVFNNAKKLKSESTPAAALNASNRVDLIAKTISVLTQLRRIRLNRRDELIHAKRYCTEMRKEIEELRRTVAHYKAITMGQPKPQDKVMMMVPMMVSHDSISSFASGMHGAYPYIGNLASPWMAAGHQTTFSAAAHPQQAMPGVIQPQLNQTQTAAAPPGSHQPNTSGIPNHSNPQYPPQPGGTTTYTPHQLMHPIAFPFTQTTNTNVAHLDSDSAAMSFASLPNPGTGTHNMAQGQTASSQAISPTPGAMVGQPSQFVPSMSAQHPGAHPHVASGAQHSFPYGLHANIQGSSRGLTNNPSAINLQGNPSALNASPPGGPQAHQGGGGNLAHCA